MNEYFMNLAVEEAKKAFKNNEVPVGAVIVKDNKVISKAYNKKEKDKLVTSHAELLAIMKASKKLNNWRLDGCDIYITLEPCPMCASAIKQARISNIYCGLNNLDSENIKIIKCILKSDKNNNEVNLKIFKNENISLLLSNFFKKLR